MGCFGEKSVLLSLKVILLDETFQKFEVKSSAKGCVLFVQVCEHLRLQDTEYFGLRYLDETKQSYWLDQNKTLASQLRGTEQTTLYFGVKYYIVDPCKLQDELTRYMLFLQLKQDVQQGRIPVSFDEAAELGALAIQSELGDYDPRRHQPGYVSEFRFVPNQTPDLEQLIASMHSGLVGKLPAAVEYMYLEKVKWMDMYGVDLHAVMGEGSVEYFIGLTPTGIVVYKGKSKVGNYFWPRVTKVNSKGKIFSIRVRDKNNEENIYAFQSATKSACRHLWKCAIEQHSFFRLHQAADTGRARPTDNKDSDSFQSRVFRQSSNAYKQSSVPRDIKPAESGSLRSAGYSGSSVQPVVITPANTSALIDDNVLDMPPPPQAVLTSDPTIPPTIQPPLSQPPPPPLANGHLTTGMNGMVNEPQQNVPAWQLDQDKGLYTSGRESPHSVRSDRLKFPRRFPSNGDVSAVYGGDKRTHRHRRNHRGRHTYMSDGADSDGSVLPSLSGPRRSQSAAGGDERRRHNHRHHRLTSGGGPGVDTPPADRRARRRQERSMSPRSRHVPEELRQHLRYDLVDPGEAPGQLTDIPYTKVEIEHPSRPRKYRYRYNTTTQSVGNASDIDAPIGMGTSSVIDYPISEHGRYNRVPGARLDQFKQYNRLQQQQQTGFVERPNRQFRSDTEVMNNPIFGNQYYAGRSHVSQPPQIDRYPAAASTNRTSGVSLSYSNQPMHVYQQQSSSNIYQSPQSLGIRTQQQKSVQSTSYSAHLSEHQYPLSQLASRNHRQYFEHVSTSPTSNRQPLNGYTPASRLQQTQGYESNPSHYSTSYLPVNHTQQSYVSDSNRSTEYLSQQHFTATRSASYQPAFYTKTKISTEL